jgi:hypothetical protein
VEHEEAGDASSAWPGLESLPPSPPTEWRWPWRRPAPPPTALYVPPGPRWKRYVAIASAVTLLGVSVLVLGRGNDPEEVARPSETSSPSRTRTTAPPTTEPPRVPDPDLDAAVVELSGVVSAHRGHPFKVAPVARRLGDEGFATKVAARIDRGAIRDLADWYRLLGLIEPGTEDAFVEQYIAQRVRNTAGLFDSVSKEVWLPGEPGTPVSDRTRMTLVHELTHVLDDQHFPFDRPHLHDPETEVELGFRAVAEGDAEWVAAAWTYGRPLTSVPAGSAHDEPGSEWLAVYDWGLALMVDARAAGGEAEADRSLADPPTTSEQILHPHRYRAREPEIDQAPPPADDREDGPGPPIGELETRQLLSSAVGAEQAARAAEGWGGDRSVTWRRKPDRFTCLRIRYVMDTPADLDELTVAFETWARAGEDRTARREGDHLDVTMCAPVPPRSGGRSPA